MPSVLQSVSSSVGQTRKLLPFGPKANKFIARDPAFDARINILAGSVRSAKAQPLDAKILTPTGWCRMGDIQVGDAVFAGDGSITRVTGVFPQGKKEIFRIGFKDGASTECCGEHLWETWTHYERSNFGKYPLRKSAQPEIRTTDQIRNSLTTGRHNIINHSIRTVGMLDFDARPTPVDPYVLGVLLGDGCFRSKRGVGFSSEDQEIVEYVNTHIPDCEVRSRSRYDYDIVFLKPGSTCPRGHEISGDNVISHKNCRDSCRQCKNLNQAAHYYRTTNRKRLKRRFENVCDPVARIKHPIREYLKAVSLAGSFSHEKYIPDDYLFNRSEVRLEVLRGLMDTDGSVYTANGGAHFSTTSERLRDGVIFLVQSFGGTVTAISSIPTFRYKGIKKTGRRVYTLALCLPSGIVPFKLTRKANAFKERTKYKPTRYIVSVESVGEKEAQCIRVAHPSHLYVTDDFIVTHNTWAINLKLLRWLCRYRVAGKKIFTGVSKQAIYEHVLSDLFELVGERNYTYNRQTGEVTLFDSKWLVIGAHDDGSEKRIRGETVGLAVCDEVVLMPRNFFLMLLSRMSPEGARLYGTTNAESPYHWLKTDVLDSKLYTRGLGQDVWTQTWLLSDNPNISQQYIEFLDRSYVGVWHARYVEGLWVLAEGAIYRDVLTPDTWYNDSSRPIDLYSRNGHQERVVAIDAGTVNAQVYGDFYDRGDDVFMDQEFYFDSRRENRQMTNSQYADALIHGDGKEWSGFPEDQRMWPTVVVDPSAASFKVELISRGVLVMDAKNDVTDGIRRVASMFGRKKMHIHERCVGTRGDLETYAWDEKAAARGEEKPVKDHDHGCDMLRYFVNTKISDWRLAA